MPAFCQQTPCFPPNNTLENVVKHFYRGYTIGVIPENMCGVWQPGELAEDETGKDIKVVNCGFSSYLANGEYCCLFRCC